jgi:hypothetical protein
MITTKDLVATVRRTYIRFMFDLTRAMDQTTLAICHWSWTAPSPALRARLRKKRP